MKKIKRNRGIEELKSLYGRCFVLPWFIGFVIFFAAPLIQSIIFSLSDVTTIPGGVDIKFNNFENYRYALLVHEWYAKWIKGSITTMLYNLPIILLLSLVLALFLNQKFRGRLFFRALYFLPVIIATGRVITMIYSTTGDSSVSGSSGVSESFSAGMIDVDQIVSLLNIGSSAGKYITQTIGSIFDLVWRCGIQIILFLAGLQSVPSALYEASKVEGATKWEEFWFITFPSLSRVTLLVGIFTMVEIITYERSSLISEIYGMMSKAIYDQTSAMLWFYFLVQGAILGLVVYLYYRFLMKRWE